jgi:hypothetical protein
MEVKWDNGFPMLERCSRFKHERATDGDGKGGFDIWPKLRAAKDTKMWQAIFVKGYEGPGRVRGFLRAHSLSYLSRSHEIKR